jgi:hypothetical protein
MDHMARLSMSFSIPANPNSSSGIFNTIRFTCNSPLQLFYSLISLNFPLCQDYDKEKLHYFISRKVGKPSVSARRRQLVLTSAYAFRGAPISSHRGKQLTMSLSILEKPFNFYYLHSMHMLHYSVAKAEILSASYEISTTTFESSLVTHQRILCKEELRWAKLAEETKGNYYDGK